jgi:hypothetical protein
VSIVEACFLRVFLKGHLLGTYYYWLEKVVTPRGKALAYCIIVNFPFLPSLPSFQAKQNNKGFRYASNVPNSCCELSFWEIFDDDFRSATKWLNMCYIWRLGVVLLANGRGIILVSFFNWGLGVGFVFGKWKWCNYLCLFYWGAGVGFCFLANGSDVKYLCLFIEYWEWGFFLAYGSAIILSLFVRVVNNGSICISYMSSLMGAIKV